jgi:ABC-type sulfate/molybdate transport systems ATPase subunit
VVTHDPRIYEHADRVLHLEDGSLRAIPPTAEARRPPAEVTV